MPKYKVWDVLVPRDPDKKNSSMVVIGSSTNKKQALSMLAAWRRKHKKRSGYVRGTLK